MTRTTLNVLIFAAAALTVAAFVMTGNGEHHLATGIAFAAFGYLVGTYGTMVGAGGGFLVVPAMVIVYHATHEQAAGTGLAVVFLNAFSGTISYAQQKRVDYRAGLTFALATLPGSIAGAFITEAFSGRAFNIVFAIMLILISALLIFRPAPDPVQHTEFLEIAPRRWHFTRHLTDAQGHRFSYQYNWVTGVVLSFFVGFLSSLLGIGGGIIHVPVLVYVLGFPPHLATATSHFILAITAGVGTITHLSLGHVLLWPAILMGIGVIGGAQIGAVLGRRVRGPWLLRFLALALIAVALRLVL